MKINNIITTILLLANFAVMGHSPDTSNYSPNTSSVIAVFNFQNSSPTEIMLRMPSGYPLSDNLQIIYHDENNTIEFISSNQDSVILSPIDIFSQNNNDNNDVSHDDQNNTTEVDYNEGNVIFDGILYDPNPPQIEGLTHISILRIITPIRNELIQNGPIYYFFKLREHNS